MKKELEVLSEETNSAVIRLPERRFPGVLVQGDTLRSWEETVEEVLDALKKGDLVEASAATSYLCEKLHQCVANYEQIMREHGIQLPYAAKE